MSKNLSDFLAEYNGATATDPMGDSHPTTVIDVPHEKDGSSPFIVVRHGDYTVVINPLGLGDHLSVDIHSFVKGEDATAGVFAMSNGRRWTLGDSPKESVTGTKSHGWPSAGLVAVLVGEQTGQPKGWND